MEGGHGGLAACGGGTSEDSCDRSGNRGSLLRVDSSPAPVSPCPTGDSHVLDPGRSCLAAAVLPQDHTSLLGWNPSVGVWSVLEAGRVSQGCEVHSLC